jgi:hypothetical protein
MWPFCHGDRGRLAVYASTVSFYQLTDDVTDRWLTQLCPGERLALDDEDRKSCIREIPISKHREDYWHCFDPFADVIPNIMSRTTRICYSSSQPKWREMAIVP